MISNQRIEELVGEIRKGKVRVDLDEVRVRSPKGIEEQVSYPFSVTIEGNHFVCRWRVPQAETLPPVMQSLSRRPSSNVSTPADNFTVFAKVENGLPVELADLSPFPSTTSRSDGPTSYSTAFDTINFPASGLEKWESGQIIDHLNNLNPKQNSLTEDSVSRNKTETLFAIIPDVTLLIVSDGTKVTTTHPLFGEATNSQSNCLLGDIYGGKFCVEAKNGDLWIYYRRSLGYIEAGPSAKNVFAGILSAIGFTHGCHPWPFYYQHVRDHIVLERWARCCPDCARDTLLPIEKRRMFLSQDAQDLFKKACQFFSATSDDAALMIRALWLMRESNRESMPFEIRLITLCSVLEGMIHRLEGQLLSKEESAKDKPRKGKWELIAGKLELPWGEVFDLTYQSWSYYRHPLSHGFQERTEEAPETLFDAYSRISAAIYILMAKAMGYCGEIASSTLENKNISLSAPTNLQV
jgi:hypothetical protein